MGKAVEQWAAGAVSPGEQEESAWDDLSRVRDGWREVEAEETRLLALRQSSGQAQMSIEDGLRHLLALQRAFEPHLQQTEALFRADRLAYLEELQRRLAQLDECGKQQGGESLSIRGGPAGSAA